MTQHTAVDPLSRPAHSWAGRYAAFKSRHIDDNDPRVIECQQARAFHRVARVIDTEAAQLNPASVEALVTYLREAAATTDAGAPHQ